MSLQEPRNASKNARLKWGPFKSLLKDWRFWLVQISLVGIAVLHNVFEQPEVIYTWGNIFFIPISLFWAPIIYSALAFGFSGTITTASLAFIVNVPNFLFWHQDPDRLWEISQLSIMMLVALLLASIIEQKRGAERRAKLYAAHSVRTREEEWRKIGRQVHDNTVQSLVTICRELDTVRYLGPALSPDANTRLATIRNCAEQTADDLRRFTKGLRPTILDDLGLVASIRRLTASFSEQSGVEAGVEVIGKEHRLTSERETIIFRIAQEALRNVERHAKATELSIVMTFAQKEVVLRISDNGIGFNVPLSASRFAAGGKFGILGMYEYAEMLGGKLKIKSHPGKGTMITAFIPIIAENHPPRSEPVS